MDCSTVLFATFKMLFMNRTSSYSSKFTDLPLDSNECLSVLHSLNTFPISINSNNEAKHANASGQQESWLIESHNVTHITQRAARKVVKTC